LFYPGFALSTSERRRTGVYFCSQDYRGPREGIVYGPPHAPSWPPQRRICWYWKITRRSPQRLSCKNQRDNHQRHGRRSIAVSKSSVTCRYDSNHCRHRQYQSRQRPSNPVKSRHRTILFRGSRSHQERKNSRRTK
jgi:hypothetical protein